VLLLFDPPHAVRDSARARARMGSPARSFIAGMPPWRMGSDRQTIGQY
jgi:hypothetical protein